MSVSGIESYPEIRINWEFYSGIGSYPLGYGSRTVQIDERIGSRLKLRDLNIFLAVVEGGSMSKAAAQLAVSQPAVSKAISNMEYALGVPLLERKARGVEPTL